MDLKQIKELMSSMKKEGIKKLTLKEKSGFEIVLESQEETSSSPQPPSSFHAYYPSFPHPHAHHAIPSIKEVEHPPMPQQLPQKGAAKEVQEGLYVTSPLVGTFYRAATPDDAPFSKVGDRVDENTVLCIIEAMKVMNEVKAGVTGVIAEILIENAHPVEFGTKIFRIE